MQKNGNMSVPLAIDMWINNLFLPSVLHILAVDMGGKKKSKANKLARMSEEEKIRYLQQRAAIEEEARRRKEQLISIFLKVTHCIQ